MSIKTLTHAKNLQGKKVLVRIDSDVDLKNGKILDDTRLQSSIETVRFLLKHGADVILLGHLGRPGGKIVKELSLLPIAKWYAKEFDGEVVEKEINGFKKWKINNNLFLLENLRFYKEEEENNRAFAGSLATLGEIFVNEAFAVSHRKHASVYSLAELLPSYAGFHLVTELEALDKIIHDPKRPLVVLIGGAKIETKLPVVSKMHHIADYVLVGGKIAEETRALIRVQHEKIQGHKSVVLVADNTLAGDDITEKDTENFIQILNLAKTVVWNGPVGKMENPKTERSTLKIAQAIIASGAYSIVGGGDSLTFLKEHHLLHKFSFVSTGGGAMLEFLSGKTLPGIEVLEK